LTGLRPSSTGVYTNNHDWREIILPKVVPLPEHFQKNGYETLAVGKISHESFRSLRGWDEYHLSNKKLYSNSDKPTVRGVTEDDDDQEYAGGVGGIRFKPLNCNDNDMEDYHNVQYAIDQLERKHDKPFFLACGLRKPHMPWNVPKKYYDMYPLEKIVLPEVLPNDLDDVPPEGIAMAKPNGDHSKILQSGRWKNAVQGYLATITFTDAMIGRLLDAFEKSLYRDNTIVVLWSDHGWHLGEKQHWRKSTLWEEANRAPLIWRVPGLTKPGLRTKTPVDLMLIYPTLCDLAGLPLPDQTLEGTSIRILLADPASGIETAAVMTFGFKNHAVRTKDWRYICYENGGEELYDEKSDPHEWTNLASKEEFRTVKEHLATFLPKENVPPGTLTPSNQRKPEVPAGLK
jgi:arylsulfatase A-like enzyme